MTDDINRFLEKADEFEKENRREFYWIVVCFLAAMTALAIGATYIEYQTGQSIFSLPPAP